MRIPFTYGKEVPDEDFTGRKEEINRLIENFKSLRNTLIFSPKGWGKSTLVSKAVDRFTKTQSNYIFCFIDLKHIKEEEDFYNLLANEVLKTVFKNPESLIENASKFLGRLYPKVKRDAKNQNEYKVFLDTDELKYFSEDILNLAEKIAADNGIRIIICFRDFQNVLDYTDPVDFLYRFRMSANDQVHVCNSISGTGIGNIFQNEDKPVLNSYDVIQLEKISLQIWIPFISARFANTGKSIDNAAAEMILQLTENHPQLVQVLGQQAWLRTPFICNEKIVAESHESLLMASNLLFRNITDNLSNTQLYFLKALINGESHFNSQKVLLNYKLGTSGNISKIKKGLTDKRIIEINDNQIQFLDPFYKAWLEKFYFKIF